MDSKDTADSSDELFSNFFENVLAAKLAAKLAATRSDGITMNMLERIESGVR